MRLVHRIAAALVLGGCVALPCEAAPITLKAFDSGSYAEDGSHLITNPNHITGLVGTTERRSFFVFDLSSVTGTIGSATLRLFNPFLSPFLPGYVSPDPAELLNIYDVSTPADVVRQGLAGTSGFADLGGGTLFGSRLVSAADNGTIVEITLNSAAIAALNAATGLFALGGALGTIDSSAEQYVFGFSVTSAVQDHTRELVLDVAAVPEPSLLLLGGVGGLALARRLRRRQ